MEIEIPQGAGAGAIAARLAEEGLVQWPRVFSLLMRVRGVDTRVRAGWVTIPRGLSPEEVLAILDPLGPESGVRVVIPEGLNRFEIAQRLEALSICSAEDFLAATQAPPEGIDAASAEGYLFPDTYRFQRHQDAHAVVQALLANFHAKAGSYLDTHPATRLSDLGFSRHELLILASIVEEEAAVPDERARIAGVFVNRLRSEDFRPRARLQADPTVSYGCLVSDPLPESCEGFDGRITQRMLGDASNLYNSYRHAGLPPGPISNPGLDALRAVLAYETHDFLYFVARGERRHDFSATLEAHNESVARLRERERSGP